MRHLWHWRGACAVGCLAAMIIGAGLGCGSDSTSPNGNGNGGEQVPDFTAQDVNSRSETFMQDIQFSTFASGKATLLYFGRATCEGCVEQFAGIDSLVADLIDEGFSVTGAMVNHHLDAPYTFWLDEAEASIPAFQDTLAIVDEQNVPKIGNLLGALDGDELLIIDAGRHLVREEKVGVSHEYDLRDHADRETVKAWVRELF